ncbi:hypothetical protein OXPF_22000 [Oxobacter pfennigii]|uniref:DUF881 domain-containing protein n=1 Tax=Oxobacter pfennigii TaxID=36849 RepID=A0A0P8W5R7_9CLOT|nr:DUF881 domain-containing protein [Oxobacter pfennigii]KPU44034.1 hypothetical protein OXPF_22000 [Oxobacter pfennigii]
MKLNESKLLVLLTSVILGFLLASQLSIGKFMPIEILTLESYQELSAELRQITDEISILNEKRLNLAQKVDGYSNSGQSYADTVSTLTDELSKIDFEIGLTGVYGTGVVISLSDNPNYGKIIDDRDIGELGLVHDYDILQLIWELKNAGAETISINDQRIIYNSDIYCGGPIIYVNGLELVPPYIIKAIGDLEALSHSMEDEYSFYRWLEARELDISYKKENELKILKYDRNIDYYYMKQLKED